MSSPTSEANATLAANRSPMSRLGFRNDDGKVRKVADMPKLGQLPRSSHLPEQPRDHPALERYK